MAKENLKVGDRVRTNEHYARDISRVKRTGVLMRELTWIGGLWRVKVLGFEQSQQMHENYLERIKGG